MGERIEAVGRIQLRGLTLLLLAFLSGALAGAAIEHLRTEGDAPSDAARVGPRPPMSGGPGARPAPGIPGDILPPPFQELDLTDGQEAEIRRILRESRPVTDSLLGAFMPRLRAVTDSVRGEIRRVLTPEQRERLEENFPAFRDGRPFPSR